MGVDVGRALGIIALPLVVALIVLAIRLVIREKFMIG